MPVRLPGPDDVAQARVQNTREVIDVPVDPMGRVFENLGAAGAEIAQKLIDQRDRNQLVSAETAATQEMDAAMREIEQGADPTQYEQQFRTRAEEIVARQVQQHGMSRSAATAWREHGAALLTRGVIASRESSQRRMLADVQASATSVVAEQQRIIQDPNSSEEAVAAAVERARALLDKSTLLGADDRAAMMQGVINTQAQRQRTTAMNAQVLATTDAIFAAHDSYAERLAAARAIPNAELRMRAEDEVTQRQARDNAALEETAGSVWQDYLNGEDFTQNPNWHAFATDPRFADAHRAFDADRRARASEAAAGTGASARESEAAGDALEALSALDSRAFMTVVDFQRGTLSVGRRIPRQPAPDMTEEDFQARTGMTSAQARALFSTMNNDDRLRVLNRRSGQTSTTAVDNAFADVLRRAEPIAERAGFAVTGSSEANAQMRGAFQGFIRREVRAYVEANGGPPDEAAADAIIARALVQDRRGGNAPTRRAFYAGEGFRVNYRDIPPSERPALLRQVLRANPNLSEDAARRQVESLYGAQLTSER